MNAASPPQHCSADPVLEFSLGHVDRDAQDLQSRAVHSLETNPIFTGRLTKCAIDIVADGDSLILHGRVPSWYLKQLLQETLRRVDGVGSVENHVSVVNPREVPLNG